MKKTYLQPITETLIWHTEDIMIPIMEVVSGVETNHPSDPGIVVPNPAPARVY